MLNLLAVLYSILNTSILNTSLNTLQVFCTSI